MNERPILAVDTGADRTLLKRDTAETWGVFDVEEYDPRQRQGTYEVRGLSIRCDEGSVQLALEADEGAELCLDVRVKFPTASEEQAVPIEVPGHRGALDLIRFAVDPPPAQRWYFGTASR